MYSYGIKNRYTPTALINKAYGWKGGGSGNLSDVPSRLMLTGAGLMIQTSWRRLARSAYWRFSSIFFGRQCRK